MSFKIKAAKLSDVILEQLENMILEGSLAPGEKLPPESELAKQFEVSRPSLREAIQGARQICWRGKVLSQER